MGIPQQVLCTSHPRTCTTAFHSGYYSAQREDLCTDLHHQLCNLIAHLKPRIQQKTTLCNLSSSQFLFQLFLQKHGHCGFLIILAPELSISQRQILPLPWAQHLAQSLTHIISNTEN